MVTRIESNHAEVDLKACQAAIVAAADLRAFELTNKVGIALGPKGDLAHGVGTSRHQRKQRDLLQAPARLRLDGTRSLPLQKRRQCAGAVGGDGNQRQYRYRTRPPQRDRPHRAQAQRTEDRKHCTNTPDHRARPNAVMGQTCSQTCDQMIRHRGISGKPQPLPSTKSSAKNPWKDQALRAAWCSRKSLVLLRDFADQTAKKQHLHGDTSA